MFNFQEAEEVSKIKRLQNSDIVIFASGRIGLTKELFDKLDLKNRKVHLLKSGNDFAIGSVEEDSTDGLKVNQEKFVNRNMHKALGGQYSEWNVQGEAIEHPVTKDTYYALVEVENGATKRAELAEAAGVSEEQLEDEASAEESAAEFESTDEVETPSMNGVEA